jgi:CheY-like chemotaxis protein
MREALTGSFPDVEISVSEDGEIMMHRIDLLDSGEEPLPDVILLDLNMPRANGDELLWRLRDSPRCQSVPTVIVTSSDSPRDRTRAAKLGAVRYFHKPIDYAAFMHLGDVVKDLIESH